MTAGEQRVFLRLLTTAVVLGSAAAVAVTVIQAIAFPSGLLPHLVCWRSEPNLVLLHLTGDLAISSAYKAIPATALYLLFVVGRPSRLAFPVIALWGAAFVLLCGVTHDLDAAEIWVPVQWVRGWAKLLTGLVSWAFVAMVMVRRQEIAAFLRALAREDDEQ